MKRKFELTFRDKIMVIELKSDMPFGVMEAKKYLKKQHPKAIKIEHIKRKPKTF
jgi:hypothetical protein